LHGRLDVAREKVVGHASDDHCDFVS
jgi:hypothetical protein